MIGWLLLALAAYLSTRSAWWLIAVGVLVLWKIAQWQMYYSRPWRRVHFPAMKLYATASGLESGQAQREGREFDVERALTTLVRMVHPNQTEADARSFVDAQLLRARMNGDAENLVVWHERKNLIAGPEHHAKATAQFKRAFEEPDNSLKVRLVVSGFVGERFGEDQRSEYLFEVAQGNAT
jgi:hypothetical protein